MNINRINSAIYSVLASSAVDSLFEARSGKAKYYKVRINLREIQALKNGQAKDTGNTEHKIQNEDKQNKTDTTQKAKKMSNTESPQEGHL